MDPELKNEGSFSTGNLSVSEIWPFGNGGFGHGLIIDWLGVENGGAGVYGDGSMDGGGGSTVTEQSGSHGGGKRRMRMRNVGPEDEASRLGSASTSGVDLKEANCKRIKISESTELIGCLKAGAESSAGGGGKPEKNIQCEPPKDYVHVRARRGEATDSHSLAERARREKITERMKILQDLVPGCNKVIGKALVLDEIINYVQSLQQQVEFLSMKLEAVNSGMAPTFSGFTTKELCSPSFDALTEQPVPQPDWLHMQ